jgi:hypothetical protein
VFLKRKFLLPKALIYADFTSLARSKDETTTKLLQSLEERKKNIFSRTKFD